MVHLPTDTMFFINVVYFSISTSDRKNETIAMEIIGYMDYYDGSVNLISTQYHAKRLINSIYNAFKRKLNYHNFRMLMDRSRECRFIIYMIFQS